MTRRVLEVTAVVIVASLGHATSPSSMPDGLQHFVFFNRDRERIHEQSFLENEGAIGAQLKYTWRELEPDRGVYALELIAADLEFLQSHGKKLFVQIQDVSFSTEIVNVPEYLRTDPAFNKGADLQYAYEGDDDAAAEPEGWVARRWDPAVRKRFALLLTAVGEAFDGRIEGINFAETAVEFGTSGRLHPDGFTYDVYRDSMLEIMSAARAAFATSSVIVYANFMPGEWLPWNDSGYLGSVYAHADTIGVGVGGPDLRPHRKGHRNHSYPLIMRRSEAVPAGIAVQWGNLDDVNPTTGRTVTVQELHAFARDTLRVDYIFWGVQEPHYSRAILPYLGEDGR